MVFHSFIDPSRQGNREEMTSDFMSFETVFQSCQDDGRMIMKGCVQGTPFMIEKVPASRVS